MTHPHPDLGAPDKLVAGGLRIVALGERRGPAPEARTLYDEIDSA